MSDGLLSSLSVQKSRSSRNFSAPMVMALLSLSVQKSRSSRNRGMRAALRTESLSVQKSRSSRNKWAAEAAEAESLSVQKSRSSRNITARGSVKRQSLSVQKSRSSRNSAAKSQRRRCSLSVQKSRSSRNPHSSAPMWPRSLSVQKSRSSRNHSIHTAPAWARVGPFGAGRLRSAASYSEIAQPAHGLERIPVREVRLLPSQDWLMKRNGAFLPAGLNNNQGVTLMFESPLQYVPPHSCRMHFTARAEALTMLDLGPMIFHNILDAPAKSGMI